MVEAQSELKHKHEKTDHLSLSIKEILDEQQRLTAALKAAPQEASESLFNEYISGEQPREPYALSPNFAYNLEFSEAVPHHIADVILTALRHKPEVALSLKPLPPSTLQSKIDELERITREQFQTAKTESEKVSILIAQIDQKKQLEKGVIDDEENFIRDQVSNLLKSFGLITELSADATFEVFTRISESNALTLELSHYRLMLREAVVALSELVPNLSSVFNDIESRVVLSRKVPFVTDKPHAKNGNNQKPSIKKAQYLASSRSDIHYNVSEEYKKFWESNANWSEISLREGIFIEVDNSTFDVHRSTQRYAEQIVIFAHEFIHSVVSYLLDEILELKNFDENKNTTHASSLWHTIQEGISIAFETELTEYLLQSPDTNEQDKDQLFKWKLLRLEALRRAATHWQKSVRRSFIGPDNTMPKPSDFGELSYSEGAKLALIFKKNGWQLSDLTFFLRQIKQVLYEEIGSSHMIDSLKVPVSKEKEVHWLFKNTTAKYLKIRKRIRSLRPNFTAA